MHLDISHARIFKLLWYPCTLKLVIEINGFRIAWRFAWTAFTSLTGALLYYSWINLWQIKMNFSSTIYSHSGFQLSFPLSVIKRQWRLIWFIIVSCPPTVTVDSVVCSSIIGLQEKLCNVVLCHPTLTLLRQFWSQNLHCSCWAQSMSAHIVWSGCTSLTVGVFKSAWDLGVSGDLDYARQAMWGQFL